MPDAHSVQAEAGEKQEEEDNSDQDYDLTKSSFDPLGNYLGSEQEMMPAVRDQPVLHDSLPRYVTKTKYLIDLVPTQKGVTSDKPTMEALPEQSSSSSTALSSETEEDDTMTLQMEEDQLLSGEVMDASPMSGIHPVGLCHKARS